MSVRVFKGGERTSDEYIKSFEHARKSTKEGDDKEKNYQPVVQAFYDIATDLYMYGWSNSFHFAPRNKGEAFQASLVRHEHWLSARLDIRPGEDVCDLGCGVGGPMVNIAKFTRANITGVTIDEFQVMKGNRWLEKNGLSKQCKIVQGDFHNLDFEAASFDKGYDMEATAHSTDLTAFFREVHRVLRKGGAFGGMAWVTTAKYDPENAEHRQIIDGVAYGNALSVVHSFEDYRRAVEAVPGLKLVEDYDCAKLGDDLTWYDPLLPKFSVENILATKPGRMFTSALTRVLETVGLAPAGVYQTTQVLEVAAECLVKAGLLDIYTPMHYYKVVKVE